ncbi:DUF6350 family protein [Citricoccus sp. SGAir0253]|uniref:cell division protein PerM n=1 Tax=Citricoccus sp. SGAir0253 TaxID=2567881 RepID=UPI001FF05AE2|nr:DUF6350 family protein [Citricoccus sp. SGAir0253]
MTARNRALRPLPLPLWIQGAIEVFLAAIVSAILVVVPLVGIWSTGGFASTQVDFVAQLGGQAWLAMHGVPLHLTLEAGPSTADTLTGTFWFLPWGLVLLPLGLGWRAGRRLARASYRDQIWQPLAGGAGTYALFCLVTALLVPNGMVAINPFWATVVPTLLMVGALLAGARREAGSWERLIGVDAADRIASLSQSKRWAGSYAWSVVRAGVVGLVASFALAAALLAVQVGLHWADIARVYQQLDAGIWGGATLTAVQLGVMPNLAAWTLAWSSGAGFALGAGSTVSPLLTAVGPQPAIPVLAAAPVGLDPAWSWLFLLLPVVGGFFAGWWLLREGENHLDEWLALKIEARWASLTVSTLALGLLVALATALLSVVPFALSGGSLGVGRLAEIGPHAGAAAGLLGLLVGFGAVLGYLVSPWWERDRLVLPEHWHEDEDEDEGAEAADHEADGGERGDAAADHGEATGRAGHGAPRRGGLRRRRRD